MNTEKQPFWKTASFPFSTGIYNGLDYVSRGYYKHVMENFGRYEEHATANLNSYEFKIEHLVVVESMYKNNLERSKRFDEQGRRILTEIPEKEKIEINAAQVEYLVKNEVKTKLFYQCGDEVVEQIRFWINDIEAAKNGTVFSLLTTDYNSLPDEFKALAEPKPSMPAHFEPDWKEAKYKELEKQLLEATALAETRQARINELEATLQIQLKHIEILENQNSELSIKCSKLSQYAITNLLNSL